MKKKSFFLYQIIAALILAIVIGGFSNPESKFLGIPYIQLSGFLGKLFLNALSLLVIPLVIFSILHGIGQMGKEQSFGSLSLKAFFFYILTTVLAILTGLFFVNLIQPGAYFFDHASISSLSQPVSVEINPHQNGIEALGQVILKLIPKNIFEAASSGNMLGIVFFTLLFGVSLNRLHNTISRHLLKIWEALFFALMEMTHLLIKVMPLGVFCLAVETIALKGLHSMGSVMYLVFTVILSLAVFMFIILPLLLKSFGVNPWQHFKAMGPALITALSTSSSAATLPITMECVEKRAGVSNRICSFVIPLGTSMNMSGSALYECVAVLFIAQVYGFELTVWHQFMIVILSLLSSLGLAGIPSGGLVAILIILNALGFPLEGLGLILPVDRILDMCRTTTNVFSDSCCARLVDQLEAKNSSSYQLKKSQFR